MYFLELVLLLATILIQKECFAGDGSLELQNGKNLITEYFVKDQRMAQPGYFHLHHFSLAFYLQEYQSCGGGADGMDGLLICYRSQLEKSEMLPIGMQPTRQYELRNLAGNGVAKQCQELAGPDWHGMLINKNDQQKWVFRFSTTNRTFTIDGGMETLQWLFYKLASAKDVGESFLSKTFDPYRDFMDWKNDHFGEAEEADNRIPQEGNEKLKGLFMKRQAMQERLQNYAGIWSLGLDMLPSKDGIDHFELFVRKSECCQHIRAFFNQPTAQVPNPKMPEIKDEQIEYPTTIYVNFTVILDGIIKPDAQNFTFEIVDQFDPKENKCQGMRFTVDFGKKYIFFQQKINNEWIPPFFNETQKIPNHFVRGAPFHFEVILSANGITLNVNCHGPVPMNLNEGTEIAFENPHLIKVKGDFKYWNDNYSKALNNWVIEGDGLSYSNESALLFQGQVNDNAKNFSIKLWSRLSNGSYNLIFELEVGIEPHYYKFPVPGAFPVQNVTPSYNAGSEFKAVIIYHDDTAVKICMYDVMSMDYVAIGGVIIRRPEDLGSKIRFVQITGDATANMEIISHSSTDVDRCDKKRID